MEKEDWQNRGEGHRQRLRDKFAEGGLDRFSDEEVVEFLLTLGTPRKDMKLPAREALKKFGSLSGVLSAPISKLTEIRGIGQKNALYLNLVHHVAGRYLRDAARSKNFFGSSKAVFDYLMALLIGMTLLFRLGTCSGCAWGAAGCAKSRSSTSLLNFPGIQWQ